MERQALEVFSTSLRNPSGLPGVAVHFIDLLRFPLEALCNTGTVVFNAWAMRKQYKRPKMPSAEWRFLRQNRYL